MKIVDALKGINRLALDTAPIIYFIEKNPTYVAHMRAIMTEVANGTVIGEASVLVLAEVLVQPNRTNNTALANLYENILTRSNHFQLHAIDKSIARKAADLRAMYNLKTPDAIHVASAISSGADAFLTNDTGIKRVTEIPILILDELEL